MSNKNISPLEHVEQVTFLNEFKKEWPEVRIFSIPNGGKRHIKVAEKLKLEGIEPGIPDLYIPKWHTWVEMKRVKGGVLSEDQDGWREYLIDECGDTWIKAEGWKDGMNQLLNMRK